MKPKEKAKELVDKFIFIDNGEKFQIISIADEKRAIQCALIAVNEIINLKLLWFQKDSKDLQYWNEVEQEIEKL